MGESLKNIKKVVTEELKVFEKHFQNSMKSKVALLDRITYYIAKRKGKQIRPLMVLLSASLYGKANDKTYVAASLVELLHTATLVHDDVVDDSNMRRGYFSINALWKNKIAVLVGDYLLSKGLLLAIDNHCFEILQIMSNSVRKMSEGELIQIEKARKLNINESIYYDIIEKKTASLIAGSCSAGAFSTSGSQEVKLLMEQVGSDIGMAFQMKDDLFDYGKADVGKPLGIDIQEKKMTLPLIYTLQNASKKNKRFIINTVKNHSSDKKKVNEVISLVKDHGGIEYTEKKMELYIDKALNGLKDVPDSKYKSSLIDLIYYVIDRNK
jgi:octaprenyl-diphosphate synthase